MKINTNFNQLETALAVSGASLNLSIILLEKIKKL